MAKEQGKLKTIIGTITGILDFWGCPDCCDGNFAGLVDAKKKSQLSDKALYASFNSLCDDAIIMLTVMRNIGSSTVITSKNEVIEK